MNDLFAPRTLLLTRHFVTNSKWNKMEVLPKDLLEIVFEYKHGMEHHEKFQKVLEELLFVSRFMIYFTPRRPISYFLWL